MSRHRSSSASRIDRGDNDNCIVASLDDDYTTTSEISVSVIIVMPTIGDAQRELDTYIHAEARSRARASRQPRACHPLVLGVGSSLITSIPDRHPIGPPSRIQPPPAPPLPSPPPPPPPPCR